MVSKLVNVGLTMLATTFHRVSAVSAGTVKFFPDRCLELLEALRRDWDPRVLRRSLQVSGIRVGLLIGIRVGYLPSQGTTRDISYKP